MEISGNIFDVQRFSIHDGPGIRTTVFLKGCPLNCFWCHNPEGISPLPVLGFLTEKCTGCGECIHICQHYAHQFIDKQKKYIPDNCITCGKCEEVCCQGAITLWGKSISANDVVEEVKKDTLFYQHSGGGVTLSGGEPLLQPQFTAELLKKCADMGFHTAIETCGYMSFSSFEKVIAHCRLFIYDIKASNFELHKRGTGVGNDLIWDNLKKLVQMGAETLIRIPVIPSYNDHPGEMEEISSRLADICPEAEVELMPFHRMGKAKYDRLDLSYQAENLQPPSVEQMEKISEIFTKKGLKILNNYIKRD